MFLTVENMFCWWLVFPPTAALFFVSALVTSSPGAAPGRKSGLAVGPYYTPAVCFFSLLPQVIEAPGEYSCGEISVWSRYPLGCPGTGPDRTSYRGQIGAWPGVDRAHTKPDPTPHTGPGRADGAW